jgi:hypothetical protein
MATRSDLLMKLFFERYFSKEYYINSPRTLNPYGVYEFRFYKNSEWITVIIDDYIPLKNGKPLFSCSKDPTEMWVCLLEKAYAKLHLCYEALDGGSEIYALVDLTGGIPETLDMQSKEIRADIASGRLWEKLLKYQSKGYLMGCARIGNPGATESDAGRGVLYNHAYGVLCVLEEDGNKLIKLRNPWGEGEWTGKWSDASDVWTPSLMKKLNHTRNDDGVFW